MIKINKHIEIVRATRSRFSSMGKKNCDRIQNVLKKHYRYVGVTIVNDIDDLTVLLTKQPDLVFLGVKKLPTRELSKQWSPDFIWVAQYLDDHNLNYTGSTASAIALEFDKPSSKDIVKAAGFSTSSYFIAKNEQYHTSDELPLKFPLFIKPPSKGGGAGIGADSVVRNFASFQQKVQSIYNTYQSHALVEEYLVGREFSVAILKDVYTDHLTAMPVEIITEKNSQGDRILGIRVKIADNERVIEVRDEKVKTAIIEIATNVFKTLGARDYGRIDIRHDEKGIPHFLEANLIPGMGGGYYTRACWINKAMDYEAVILRIVELGLSRSLTLREVDLLKDMGAILTCWYKN